MLSLFAAIINKLGRKMEKEVPRIFEAVFQVTLDMITKNFEVGGGTQCWTYIVGRWWVQLRCFQDSSAACETRRWDSQSCLACVGTTCRRRLCPD